MPTPKTQGLDALLYGPLVELEAELQRIDRELDHALGDGSIHLVRSEEDLHLESDECEIYFMHRTGRERPAAQP